MPFGHRELNPGLPPTISSRQLQRIKGVHQARLIVYLGLGLLKHAISWAVGSAQLVPSQTAST
jgi:hypothetical protein